MRIISDTPKPSKWKISIIRDNGYPNIARNFILLSDNHMVTNLRNKIEERINSEREFIVDGGNNFIFEARLNFEHMSGNFTYFKDVEQPEFIYSFGHRGMALMWDQIHSKNIRVDIDGSLVGQFTFYNTSGWLHTLPYIQNQ